MDQKAPHFELRRVYDDGAEQDAPQIYPILDLPVDARMNRRGFFGAGLTLGAVLAAATGCTTTQPRRQETKPAVEPKPVEPSPVAEKPKPAPPTEQAHTCATDIKAHSKYITSLAFSGDGRWLASGSGDNTVKLWTWPDGKLHKTLKEKNARTPRDVRFSADSRWLIAVGDDHQISAWEPASGKLRHSFRGASRVAISPDAKWLVTPADKEPKQIQVLAYPSGKLYKNIVGHLGAINELAVSPDGRWLASASADLSVEVWSLPEGANQLTRWRRVSSASGLAFSPDSSIIASGTEKNAVKLWTIADGKEVVKLSGHRGPVTSLAFSPDGKMMATASIDHTVKLWSLPDGRLTATLKGHKKPVNSVAFSPNGRWLASGGADSTIRMWSIPAGEPANCLFDTSTMSSKKKANQYTTTNAYGETVTYTLPCGSPIPAGAVCTCNCVPGTYTAPVTRRRTQRYCTCNKVCTCVPVYYCQAHRLLDDDPDVRVMAEELLLIMGSRGIDYLCWAANEVDGKLRARILEVLHAVREGVAPDLHRWPKVSLLERYLEHHEPVTALMAGQLILQHQRGTESGVDSSVLSRAQQIVASGEQRHRAVRAQVNDFLAKDL